MASEINQATLQALKKPFQEAQKNGVKSLKHLFADGQYFKTQPLDTDTIFPVTEADKNVQKCFEKLADIDKYDIFTSDYLLRKYLSFVAYKDLSLYELCKQEAIFASAKYALQANSKDTDDKEAKNLLIISGDFFGIQRFIFEETPANKAAKTLRAKSANVQIFIRLAAFYIVEQLNLSYLSIISTSAGKFEILGIDTTETRKILKKIQKELNEFFIKNYFGETGIGISAVSCSFSDLEEKEKYRKLRQQIKEQVDESKFHKFDILDINPILSYDDDVTNQTLCHYCYKRKKNNNNGSCDICGQFIKLGEQLTKDGFLAISKNSGEIHIFGDYYISFDEKSDKFKNPIAIYDIGRSDFRGYAKWEIASYVKYDGKTHGVMDFDELAELSCDNNAQYGLKALIALKGDVDGMGNFIKNSEVTANFANFNFFSRLIDYFFSVYASHLMCENYKNLYTVFGGGDDLFIFGVWDQVIDFAEKLQENFKCFTSNKLSFSVGMALSKANKPVSSIARIAEDELKRAKDIDGKDAIALFGECVKWDKYISVRGDLLKSLHEFEEKSGLVINSAFLYHLLELIDMSRSVKNKNREMLWKSKLHYTFSRNISEHIKDEKINLLADSLLNKLNDVIKNHREETRMVLSEYIYKRRGQYEWL
jgi:CRISPR-associated protein Csm1